MVQVRILPIYTKVSLITTIDLLWDWLSNRSVEIHLSGGYQSSSHKSKGWYWVYPTVVDINPCKTNPMAKIESFCQYDGFKELPWINVAILWIDDVANSCLNHFSLTINILASRHGNLSSWVPLNSWRH